MSGQFLFAFLIPELDPSDPLGLVRTDILGRVKEGMILQDCGYMRH